MTYILHNRLGSAGFVIEAMLSVADIPFELELIDSKPSTKLPDSFRAVNPWRQVPVLFTPDGRMLTETAAMVLYLTAEHETCSDGLSLAVNDTAALHRWAVFMTANIYEAVLRRAYPARAITGDDDDTDNPVDPALLERVRNAGFVRGLKALGVIDAAIEPGAYLTGPQMSGADIYLAMLTGWHGRQEALPQCSRIAERVACHRQINPIWQRNFGDRMSFAWHQAMPLWG